MKLFFFSDKSHKKSLGTQANKKYYAQVETTEQRDK